VDVRGFDVKLAQDVTTAAVIGGVPSDLPSRALGLAFGANFYPLRSSGMAFGIGAELMAGGGKSRLVDEQNQTVATIEEHIRSVAGTISINFGHRDGWSYLSAGTGPVRFNTYAGSPPAETPPIKSSLNAGGGGRWFGLRHLAFCFDVRVYLVKAIPTTFTAAGRDKHKLVVISVGVAIK
jgi:hypothetical protein